MLRVTAVAWLLVLPLLHAVEPARRPNVIVVFSDDHGWADLGANGTRTDVKTPHLDQLARDGVRFTRGYVTAPQCVPSRAGLLTGRYQQRCGVDDNTLGPLPKNEKTIAQAMTDAGYRTGMVGKWHLDLKMEQADQKGTARQPKRMPGHLPHKFGFQEMFCGEMNNYHATHDLAGQPVDGGIKVIANRDYRVDVQTAATLSFIDRNAAQPFFLYLAYFAPHVPSEAPAKYLDRFMDVKDEKRRVGLAMVSAVDDGVGQIRDRLTKLGLYQNTLIIFIGDNGAPTKPNAWNGSLNDPLVGEKGMLTDGGIRVPFLAAWPGKLPKGQVYEKAVSSLDVFPTALAAAGVKPNDDSKLDGVNLVPFLTGEDKGLPHAQLYWKWRSQAAVLKDQWKLVFLAPDTWHLFDTTKPEGEKAENDLATKDPEKVADLKKKLLAWDATLKTPGLPQKANAADRELFENHVNKPKAEPSTPKKLNVVFILADDLGGHDIGCYGSTFHKTPHLDSLAKRGMLFTNAYAASPLCSPTRSSLLTGLHPARIGITAPNCHLPTVQLEKRLASGGPTVKVLVADSITRLKSEYVTLPKTLKAAGYRTGHFGKWHLGAEPYSPLQHGFDVDVPHMAGPGPGGANGYFAPWSWWKGEGKPGDHIDDRMSEEAAKFIAANKDQPFFLNYWAFGVHSPWMGKTDYIEEAAKRIDPKAGQRNPVYAAMVRSLDDSVGRIVAELEKHKLLDNTVIIFTSDNGGWHNVAKEATNNKAYKDVPVTSNAPFRSGKASNYEGGTRVPLLVAWPGHTKPGSISDTVVQSTDFFPTLLAVTGTPAPKGVRFDGTDVSPAFTGQTVKREMIFSHFPHGGRGDIDGFRPGTWVRKGDWKLIRFFGDNDDGSDKLELYNLKDDIGESKDMAAAQPDLAKELNAHIAAFLKDTEAVVPKVNPNYKKPGAAVAGWTTSKDAKLESKDGVLVITSTGGDPYVVIRDIPVGAGPYTLVLKMKSNSKGDGQVFWATADEKTFLKDRSVSFTPTHDGEWHTHELKLPAEKPLTALRLDLSTAAGEIRVETFTLKDKEGRLLKTWASPDVRK